MKNSENEIEFVEFKRCDRSGCGSKTDLICVSCDKWFCRDHKRVCVQCEQLVCKECYKQDLCCLIRPWGEETERHFKDFYQNKLVTGKGMYSFDGKVKYGNEYRMKSVKRSIAHYVVTFNTSSLSDCKPEFVRDYFPKIAKYVENEEMHREFVSFMEQLFGINSFVFTFMFSNKNLREDLLTVMDESIRSNEDMRSDLIFHALKSEKLFGSLKNRKLLDWNLIRYKHCAINHIDAMKWIEQNGVDVVNNQKLFNQFAKFSTAEIMEYLIVEKGMTVEYMLKNIPHGTFDILKMVYRLKGIEAFRNTDPEIWKDLKSMTFLKSIGYKFNERTRNNSLIYWMICLEVIKYEDLNELQSKAFVQYVKRNDIKACKHLYPFMKEIRKKKIMTVILCIRKTCILQKEIIWNILDLAYSPINERGSI